MTVTLEPRDLDLFGPAVDLGELWHAAATRRAGPSTVDREDATALALVLLEWIARSDPHDPMAVDGVARLLGEQASLLPDLEGLNALRTVVRQRATTRLPLEVAAEVAERAEQVVDAFVALRVRSQIEALESAAFVDPLTGVGNRRALDRDLARELARVSRHLRPVTIATLDLDGLKAINDLEGHAAGDHALQQLARAAQASLRAADNIYRVGGDEFVLVLPETEPPAIPVILDRVRASAPSFSVGLASAPGDGTDPGVLLRIADADMLASRRRARADPPPSDPPMGRPTRVAGTAHDRPGEIVRLQVLNLRTITQDQRFSVEVTVRAHQGDIIGWAAGSSASAARPRIAADATLDALTTIDAGLRTVHLDAATYVHIGGLEVALVSLVLGTATDEDVMIGSAPVGHRGHIDAVARAVLDAVNRRLGAPERYR
jgi:diguanylate cyclase (GGDEF)-like protein